MKIGVDLMGGDNAPEAIVSGVQLALKKYQNIDFVLFGRQEELENVLHKHKLLHEKRVSLVDAPQVVKMDDNSAIALRAKKNSSISIAVSYMKDGKIDAVVSAGHTGAAVASSVVKMRTLPNIDRPGIATIFPSPTGPFVLLDAGANVDAKSEHLVQYAIMGEIYAKYILGRENPRIGILSIGEEEEKGNELTKKTLKELNKLPINFIGNVEGSDLFENKIDVVICDGFVGNIVLKTSESLAKSLSRILKKLLKKTPVRLAGALLSQNAFKELKRLSDYAEYGGAPLLGINGTCIIAHGSSSPKAIMNAIRVAKEFIQHDINHRITKRWEAVNTIEN